MEDHFLKPDDGHSDDIPNLVDTVEGAFDQIKDNFNRLLKKEASSAPLMMERNDFFRAVKNNKKDDVLKMLGAGADPNAYSPSGQTALHILAVSKTKEAEEIVHLLIDRGADPCKSMKDKPGHTPLEDAVKFNNPVMVELLARRGGYAPGMMVDGWSLLHRACERNRPNIVRILLEAGAKCNETTDNGSTPLLIAVRFGHVELVEALLKFPAVAAGLNEFFIKTDDQERTAFQMAVDSNRAPMISLMIAAGADVNRPDGDGEPPLFYAIRNGRSDIVRILTEAGADLNKTDKALGVTPLAYACYTDKIDDGVRAEMIDLLIRLGADADIQTLGKKMTPLHILQLRIAGIEAALPSLLNYPVNKEIRNDQGETPLMMSMRRRQDIQSIIALLKAGADPNAWHGEDAGTPLIMAVRHGASADVIDALLQAGANPVFYDALGKSALSYAYSRRDDTAVQLLKNSLLNRKQSAGKHPYGPSGS